MLRGMGDGEGIEGERWEWGAEIVCSANKLKLTSRVCFLPHCLKNLAIISLLQPHKEAD